MSPTARIIVGAALGALIVVKAVALLCVPWEVLFMAGQPPARPRSETRQRTELVALRLLPVEREYLHDAATAAGKSLSAYIRDAALTAADRESLP